ncbi:MAG: sugar phosphate isomerase/epimerase [Bacteroidota bacterium]|nr:sugar phosphate isomerase/epimerase [Bacteroidota bacterium]
MKKHSTRREFLGTTAVLLSGMVVSSNHLFGAPAFIRDLKKKRSLINGVQIGVITYSFRDMQDQSAEATLKYVLDAGVNAIELMGGPAESFAGAPKNLVDMRTVFPLMRKRNNKQQLTEEEQTILTAADKEIQAYREVLAKWRLSVPMEKFEKLRKMYNEAGVQIYAFKPDTFGLKSTEGEIDYGLRAAKILGANHVTLEHPGNDAHTLKLGQMAQKHGLRIGYHGHEQQTPTFWDAALSQSPANALNLDLGHYIAAGNTDVFTLLQQKHNRIASMHIKDRQTPEQGKKNVVWGQGNTPIKEVLRLMRDRKYAFPATIEMEYQVPPGSTSVAEVKKCLEFCRTVLSQNA